MLLLFPGNIHLYQNRQLSPLHTPRNCLCTLQVTKAVPHRGKSPYIPGFVFLNRRIEQISGRSRNEFIGRDFLDLLTPESRGSVKDEFQKILAEKGVNSVKMEVTLSIDEGEERYFEVVLVKTFDPTGIVHIYGVGRDITERKEMQQQLVQSEKLSSLGEIISGVAHELNNPINFVSGNVKPLLRDVNDVFTIIRKYDEIVKSNKLEGSFGEVDEMKAKMDLSFLIKEIITVTSSSSCYHFKCLP